MIHIGDCLKVMRTLPDNSVDAVITDPPYHLTSNSGGPRGKGAAGPHSRARAGAGRTGFMGKAWDGGDIAHSPETWAETLRLAKPGAWLLAFGGTRTFHRLACAIEDAGWELRDTVLRMHGGGGRGGCNARGLPVAAGMGIRFWLPEVAQRCMGRDRAETSIRAYRHGA